MVEEYLNVISSDRKEKLELVISYIKEKFPQAVESLDYAPKTKIPTYKIGTVYIALASMKNHISIHFAKYGATEIIGMASPKIKVRVGCVNIPDSVVFPIEEIKKAVNYCYEGLC